MTTMCSNARQHGYHVPLDNVSVKHELQKSIPSFLKSSSFILCRGTIKFTSITLQPWHTRVRPTLLFVMLLSTSTFTFWTQSHFYDHLA